MDNWVPIGKNEEIPFTRKEVNNILRDPRKIYEFLKSKVYGQDEALISASMLLYNHVYGRPQHMIFTGSTGSGKSEIFRAMHEIYPYIIITNAATVSKTGLVGDDPSSCLREIGDAGRQYIVCLDEFDKICESSVCQEENVQSEYLAMIQPSETHITLRNCRDERTRRIRIDKFSWILIGTFAGAVEEVAKNKPLDQLSIDDLIKYGGLKAELAGRMSNLVKLKGLSSDEYLRLIRDFDNGPLKVIEKMYGFDKGYIRKNIINARTLKKIAQESFESGLGVRYAYGRITEMVDRYVFDNFDMYSQKNCVDVARIGI